MNCQARRARQIWYHDRSAEYRSLDGILVQLPLPSHIDAQKVTSAIDPKTLMAFIR
ncbi:tetrahydrofolate dehydrogenase/cyclohydrolase catalytic domain-containing protein [Bradyrhizobium sp. F1.4.3]|uniref:tetrahydrofolate dehydrogenase/cyclohydrolase catalytic domain-containing protein n=1 Tax=Bradyrhizobium sp. F1.4.3 TaxID=3156356 RepID=UPI00339307F4